MNEEQRNRITLMEEKLNNLDGLIKELNPLISQAEESLTSYEELTQYYMGASWRKDFEDSNKPNFPSPTDLPHGVLSEDAINDLIYEYRLLGDRLIDLGEKIKRT